MSNLRIAELDFDTIKTNLKNFLQSQDTFSDYDFEGSNLSTLLDILSYNTHYNAFLANMLMNEMFLDSAVKRSSAISIAKHLGYIPTSVRSSRANLNVAVTSPSGLPLSITMDRYTQFTSIIDGTTYTFSTNATKVAPRTGLTYTFSDVEVIEGTLKTITFVVSDNTPNGKYEIPDLNIDTTSLEVVVQTSTSDTTSSIYTLASDITGLTPTSQKYFLELSPLERYQLFFGDGILGKQLSIGNIITVRYVVSSGAAANVSGTVSQSFSAVGTIAGSSNISVTVNSNSTGGADAESITSIKFNAPRVNATKNRAVTATDYEALIIANYSGAESVSVWGGEDNDPPQYGKVMIALKPYTGFTISEATKEQIKRDILKNRQIVSVQPEFVEPEYLFVKINADIVFNQSFTTQTSSSISNLVRNTITNYFTTDLNKFNKNFNYSKVINNILDADPSIVSAILTLKLQKRFLPALNTNNIFVSGNALKFRNPIKPGDVTSTYFYVSSNGAQVLAKIIDIPEDNPPNLNGTGILRLVSATTGVTILRRVGSVNYGTGEITITGLSPTSLPTNVIDIRINCGIQESFYNLSVSRNEVLVLDNSTIITAGGQTPGINITVSAQ